MSILFRRSQLKAAIWDQNSNFLCKLELSDEEKELISRDKIKDAVLVVAEQPGLLWQSLAIGAICGLIITLLLILEGTNAVFFGLVAGAGAGYWGYHTKRETIYVRDLWHGRNFVCNSVVELASKEATLRSVSGFLRQVMESSKHWDGQESQQIDPLPPEEARQFIIQGL